MLTYESIKLYFALKSIGLIDFVVNCRYLHPVHRLLSYLYDKIYSTKNEKKYSEEMKFPSEKFAESFSEYRQMRESGTALNKLNIVFICDGNRRWAKSKGIHAKLDFKSAKKAGLSKISDMIKYTYIEGASSVSFYVLALRNMKRTEEVEQIVKYIKEIKPTRSFVKINFYGDISALKDKEVVKIIDAVEKMSTANYDGHSRMYDNSFCINFFIAYNASVCDLYKKNRYLYFDEPVDILIRTSGERRLSDFMTRQVSKGLAVEFVSTLWPDLQYTQMYLLGQKHFIERIYLINKNV